MAFLKKANATLTRPQLSAETWQNFRDSAPGRIVDPFRRTASGPSKDGNLVNRASEIFGRSFKPSDYLLTHCTIVCSVDTHEVTGVKTGSVMDDGQRITRKWADYRIKPECDKFINNNLDAWSRPVLLSSYPSFVGAHNFVEHVQVEDLSKGRIIDAAIRDIGPSLYVDILVATDRKHNDLVAAIESGRLDTLSMGCSVLATLCTKCGNVAADETELCSHVKYMKGNKFFDERGHPHRVAELCGHIEMQPTGGVQFIEASWVASPAFPGAVMRNILEAPSADISKRAEEILSTPPPQWTGDLRAAASEQMPPGNSVTPSPESAKPASKSAFEGFDDPSEGGDEEPEKSPLDKAKDEIYEALIEDAKQRAKKEIRQREQEEAVSDGELGTSRNESVNRQANISPAQYKAGVDAFIRTSSSDGDFLNNLALFNESHGIGIPVRLYRAALDVGPITHFPSPQDFLGACRKAMRIQTTDQLSDQDRISLMHLGSLLSIRAQVGA